MVASIKELAAYGEVVDVLYKNRKYVAALGLIVKSDAETVLEQDVTPEDFAVIGGLVESRITEILELSDTVSVEILRANDNLEEGTAGVRAFIEKGDSDE